MKKILFVCTGNTCRSPMAMALFNKRADELSIDSEAFSRGLYADGSAISRNALKALSEVGITELCHFSATITEDDMKEADIVIGITSRHAAKLIADFPQYCDKVYAFPFDVSDPIGGDITVYRKTLKELQEGIDIIIREVFPECL